MIAAILIVAKALVLFILAMSLLSVVTIVLMFSSFFENMAASASSIWELLTGKLN